MRGTRATATLVGRRLASGASSAELTWSGAASLLLPRATLRIVDDQLYVRVGREQAWRLAGGASGISLDVGRELLMHPFLLESDGHRIRPHVTVQLVAPIDALRAYASTERQGPATELLRDARTLRIAATARSGRLAGDRFTLVTRIPDDFGDVRFAGRRVVIRARTGYCPLRRGDRRTITVPRPFG